MSSLLPFTSFCFRFGNCVRTTGKISVTTSIFANHTAKEWWIRENKSAALRVTQQQKCRIVHLGDVNDDRDDDVDINGDRVSSIEHCKWNTWKKMYTQTTIHSTPISSANANRKNRKKNRFK